MKLHFFTCFLPLAACLVLLQACTSVKDATGRLVLPSLPPANGSALQAGVAAPFAGIHQGVILLAGGSNFQECPLAEGGEKQYHDYVYILHNCLQDTVRWEVSSVKFPDKAAHGVSISIPQGVVCMGGKNAEQHLSNVWLMRWNEHKQTVEMEAMPALPYNNADMGGALAGSRIYLAGGAINGKAGNRCIYLELSEDGEKAWQSVPDFPGPARLQPAVAAQYDGNETCLYVFGGYDFDVETNAVPDILTDGYKFIPSQHQWVALSTICVDHETRAMVGASAISTGHDKIVFLGGVDKTLFFYDQDIVRQIRQAQSAQDTSLLKELTAQRRHYWLQPPEFFRFNKDIIVYRTVTNTWEKAGVLPGQPFAGAAVVKADDYFIMINGEIKPGVRTNEVYAINSTGIANN
ncbi:MAG: cyclically-permuted mutarotase family protein [Prevotellaceae bacterium]|jgi:cyclically-permuted mutarotase family protein|nr:cyclically-permuted mutarotase family protein [Prevotellaceae bacterium]